MLRIKQQCKLPAWADKQHAIILQSRVGSLQLLLQKQQKSVTKEFLKDELELGTVQRNKAKII